MKREGVEQASHAGVDCQYSHGLEEVEAKPAGAEAVEKVLPVVVAPPRRANNSAPPPLQQVQAAQQVANDAPMFKRVLIALSLQQVEEHSSQSRT